MPRRVERGGEGEGVTASGRLETGVDRGEVGGVAWVFVGIGDGAPAGAEGSARFLGRGVVAGGARGRCGEAGIVVRKSAGGTASGDVVAVLRSPRARGGRRGAVRGAGRARFGPRCLSARWRGNHLESTPDAALPPASPSATSASRVGARRGDEGARRRKEEKPVAKLAETMGNDGAASATAPVRCVVKASEELRAKGTSVVQISTDFVVSLPPRRSPSQKLANQAGESALQPGRTLDLASKSNSSRNPISPPFPLDSSGPTPAPSPTRPLLHHDRTTPRNHSAHSRRSVPPPDAAEELSRSSSQFLIRYSLVHPSVGPLAQRPISTFTASRVSTTSQGIGRGPLA